MVKRTPKTGRMELQNPYMIFKGSVNQYSNTPTLHYSIFGVLLGVGREFSGVVME